MGLTVDLLRELLQSALVDSGETKGAIWITVRGDDLSDVVRQLRTHPELRFDWFVDLCGVDYVPREPRFETVIHLHSMERGHRIRIRCLVPDDSLTVSSLTPFWPAADWYEREAYDMYGIRFRGHPNLERILNPPGTTAFPQRKDYPLKGARETKEES